MADVTTDLKTAKKGEGVHMYTFTGMYLGIFEITAADKKSISIEQKNGRTTKFDRETGKQLEAKTPRCASMVSATMIEKKAKPAKKGAKSEKPTADAGAEKKSAKKASKKAKPQEDSDEDYEEA